METHPAKFGLFANSSSPNAPTRTANPVWMNSSPTRSATSRTACITPRKMSQSERGSNSICRSLDYPPPGNSSVFWARIFGPDHTTNIATRLMKTRLHRSLSDSQLDCRLGHASALKQTKVEDHSLTRRKPRHGIRYCLYHGDVCAALLRAVWMKFGGARSIATTRDERVFTFSSAKAIHADGSADTHEAPLRCILALQILSMKQGPRPYLLHRIVRVVRVAQPHPGVVVEARVVSVVQASKQCRVVTGDVRVVLV